MIDVGFTGTRHGMTPAQVDAVIALVKALRDVTELCGRHGDCDGADRDFHRIVRGFASCIVIHPPVDERLRAFCHREVDFSYRCEVVVMPAKTHFARNRDIVDKSRVMIATPYEPIHQDRGGTWYTVDYAKKRGTSLALVLPAPSGVMIEFSGKPWPAAA